MKSEYPDYRALMKISKGVNFIEANLSQQDKTIYNDYMNFLKTTAGARKMNDYRMYFLQFIDIIEKPLSKLKAKDIIEFWALVNQDTKREVATKNTIKVTVKRFVKFFYENDLEMLKVLDKLKLKHQLVNEKKINKNMLLTPEEIALLIRATNSLREKAQVVSLYETACRPHELRTAKWKQVDFDKNTITLFSNKTKKSRELPIKNAVEHLRRWKKENKFSDLTEEDFIFPSPRDRKKSIGEFEFGYWLRELGKKANLSKPVYAYLFRHTRLTELKRLGVDDLDRKAFAGHTPTSKMQAVYISLDNDDMKKSILEKVYKVQELSDDKKHKLEKELEEFKQATKETFDKFLPIIKSYEILTNELRKQKINLKISPEMLEIIKTERSGR